MNTACSQLAPMTHSSSALFQRTILRVREFSLPFLQLPSARYGKAPGTRDQYHRSQLTSVMPYLVHQCLATAESAKVKKKLRGWHVLLFIHFSSSSSFFFLHEKQRTRRRNTVTYKSILFHTHFYSILAACKAQDQLQLQGSSQNETIILNGDDCTKNTHTYYQTLNTVITSQPPPPLEPDQQDNHDTSGQIVSLSSHAIWLYTISPLAYLKSRVLQPKLLGQNLLCSLCSLDILIVSCMLVGSRHVHVLNLIHIIIRSLPLYRLYGF